MVRLEPLLVVLLAGVDGILPVLGEVGGDGVLQLVGRVLRVRLLGLAESPARRGKHQAGEDADDGDDHEQLQERETRDRGKSISM